MLINELQIILLKIEKKFGKSLVIETLYLYLRMIINETIKKNAMKTTNEILKMTHQELMNSSDDIRQMYREAKKMENLTKATNLIAQGYKHLQFERGCIQKKKNVNGDFYVIKNGNGTGKVTNTFLTLKESISHLYDYGWGEIVDYK